MCCAACGHRPWPRCAPGHGAARHHLALLSGSPSCWAIDPHLRRHARCRTTPCWSHCAPASDRGGRPWHERIAEITRKTRETDIALRLNLDGAGNGDIATGVPFLDHMLSHVAVHGLFDLDLRCHGRHADRRPPHRGGYRHRAGPGAGPGHGRQSRPRRAMAASSCPWTRRWRWWRSISRGARLLVYDVALAHRTRWARSTPSWCPSSCARWRTHAGLTLHVKLLHGANTHHIIEAIFKGLGRALGQAVALRPASRRCALHQGSALAMLTIIDYGVGNLRSVYMAFRRLGVEAVVTADAAEIAPRRRRWCCRAWAPLAIAIGQPAGAAPGGADPARPSATACPSWASAWGCNCSLRSARNGRAPWPGRAPGARASALPAGLVVPHMGWNQIHQRQRGAPLAAACPTTAMPISCTPTMCEPEDASVGRGHHRLWRRLSARRWPEATCSPSSFTRKRARTWASAILRNFLRLARHLAAEAAS